MTRSDELALAIGITVRYIRLRELNITQEELAKRLNVTHSHIGHIEYARFNIGIASFEKLAAALDLPAGELLTRAIDFADNELHKHL
jgi:transcriptional regulator with XRE-family HTH domain